MNTPGSTIDIEQELTQQMTIHKGGLGQEVMVTTVDKVRLCLIENENCLTAKREWLIPLSLFVTILACLMAAEFKDYFLSAAVWEALFVLGGLISGLWLLISGSKAWSNRKHGGIDTIICSLKQSSAVTNDNQSKDGDVAESP